MSSHLYTVSPRSFFFYTWLHPQLSFFLAMACTLDGLTFKLDFIYNFATVYWFKRTSWKQLKRRFFPLFSYPSGIVISKDGVAINQNQQKAMLLANARHILPTLAGIPLDLQLRSSAALRMNTVANVNIGASLLSFWYFKKFNGNVEINPR